MAEGGFRLPGASYEDLANVIVAYGTRDEASNPGDIRKLDAVHRSSASRTNGFLVDIGILRGEREKLVTRRGRELALALYDRDEQETKSLWRRIVATSEFLQNVVSAVKMQEGVSYEAVQAYIAHATGQPRNKPVMIGSSTLIEILKVASFLKEEDGRIFVLHDYLPSRFPQPEIKPAPEDDPVTEATGEEAQKTNKVADPEARSTADRERAPASFESDPSDFSPTPPATGSDGPSGKPEGKPDGEPVINIHLHITCAPEDLEDLTPRLKAMISALKESSSSGPDRADELSLNFGPGDF
ncbi:MAG: hypothetical protein ACR2KW_01735 [Rubrobacter sp.]